MISIFVIFFTSFLLCIRLSEKPLVSKFFNTMILGHLMIQSFLFCSTIWMTSTGTVHDIYKLNL